VPKEVRPGETRRFGVINDGMVSVSASKARVGTLVDRYHVVLSGSGCPESN
jgi:hypothetical protein